MLNEVISATAATKAEKLQAKLLAMGGRKLVNMFERMDMDDLSTRIRAMESRISQRKKSLLFGRELSDPTYTMMMTELGVAAAVMEDRKSRADARKLVSGMTYYRRTQVVDKVLSGEKCAFIEGREPGWVSFSIKLPVAKAIEILRCGSDDDFRKIRYMMADGGSISENHFKAIAESSKRALDEIEQYCDQRWDGAWPWELEVPTRLRNMISEGKRKRMNRLEKERRAFDLFVAALTESDVDKSEVILDGRDLADKISDMIETLGRISAEIMTSFKDKLRTHFGPQASDALNQIFNDRVSHAVDALSDLRDAVGSKLDQLENGTAGADPMAGGMPGGDPMAGGADPHAAAAGLADGMPIPSDGADAGADGLDAGDGDLDMDPDAVADDDEDDDSGPAERKKKKK